MFSAVMIIDDNPADNYLHKLLLDDEKATETLLIFELATKALTYLATNESPDVIFLDVNMPVMDGWEFLEAYGELDADKRGAFVVMMLSQSLTSRDLARSREDIGVDMFVEKPLTEEILADIQHRLS